MNYNRIRLELSSNCQLKCPICLTTLGITKRLVDNPYVSFTNFKKLIDNSPQIKNIETSHQGEIFLNPDLFKIIQYSYENSITLTADSGVNLNSVSKDILEALVKYKFRSFFVSIDGATQEVYSKYRIGGNISQVFENINIINYYKKKYKSRLPLLIWQFIEFNHNKHEVKIAKNIARKFKMGFIRKIACSEEDIKENVNNILYRLALKKINKEKFEKISHYPIQVRLRKHIQKHICAHLWYGPQIRSNGQVTGCCRNLNFGDYGNAFDTSIVECINSEKMKYAKKMLMGKNKERKDIPCFKCPNYISMKHSQNWITQKYISMRKMLLFLKNDYLFQQRLASFFHESLFYKPYVNT
ncbi:radical SAM protein [Candidatus Magnetomorum sp. HK-1]|nr:radical SAM protein [Candidatus Magnetomorum sp. HK-1]